MRAELRFAHESARLERDSRTTAYSHYDTDNQCVSSGHPVSERQTSRNDGGGEGGRGERLEIREARQFGGEGIHHMGIVYSERARGRGL